MSRTDRETDTRNPGSYARRAIVAPRSSQDLRSRGHRTCFSAGQDCGPRDGKRGYCAQDCRSCDRRVTRAPYTSRNLKLPDHRAANALGPGGQAGTDARAAHRVQFLERAVPGHTDLAPSFSHDHNAAVRTSAVVRARPGFTRANRDEGFLRWLARCPRAESAVPLARFSEARRSRLQPSAPDNPYRRRPLPLDRRVRCDSRKSACEKTPATASCRRALPKSLV